MARVGCLVLASIPLHFRWRVRHPTLINVCLVVVDGTNDLSQERAAAGPSPQLYCCCSNLLIHVIWNVRPVIAIRLHASQLSQGNSIRWPTTSLWEYTWWLCVTAEGRRRRRDVDDDDDYLGESGEFMRLSSFAISHRMQILVIWAREFSRDSPASLVITQARLLTEPLNGQVKSAKVQQKVVYSGAHKKYTNNVHRHTNTKLLNNSRDDEFVLLLPPALGQTKQTRSFIL